MWPDVFWPATFWADVFWPDNDAGVITIVPAGTMIMPRTGYPRILGRK